MKKLRMILLALLLALGVSGMGNASTMTDLMNGGWIQVGDKLFSEWSYIVRTDDPELFTQLNDFNLPIAFDFIEVVELNDDLMNPGIRFRNIDSNVPLFSVDNFHEIDIEFTFKVSVLDPLYQIDGVSLAFDGSIADNFWGIVAIGDDIDAAGGPFDPWVELDPSASGGPSIIYSDSTAFDPVSEIWVTKDILLLSLDENVEVKVNWVDQYFHQTPVPEPTTMLLMGVGLLGICGVTRKKRA